MGYWPRWIAGLLMIIASIRTSECYIPLSRSLIRPRSITKSRINSVSQKQIAILDGAEYFALESCLAKEEDSTTQQSQPSSKRPLAGTLTVITGQVDNERVVGIESSSGEGTKLDDNVFLDEESVAIIPKDISDADAISTALAALVHIHCALPTVDGVGGSQDGTSFVSGKAVVLGGGEYARFAATGMATLGAEVYLISANNVNVKHPNVRVMTPAIGDEDEGFANVIGKFDSVLDTLHDETNLMENLDEDYVYDAARLPVKTPVIAQLERSHGCHKYISTFNIAQSIVRNTGVLFGPNKAKNYQSQITSKRSQLASLQSPQHFGKTLQKLLDSQILFPSSSSSKQDVSLRNWSLKDFWEFASWPRDSTGTIGSRYGLPVTEEIDSYLSPSQRQQQQQQLLEDEDETDNEEQEEDDQSLQQQQQQQPIILDIEGVKDLQTRIVSSSNQNYILFCSASWCKTCKRILPRYNRMARRSSHVKVNFAQASTDTALGKLLSRELDIESVPKFILFRNGERYGNALDISRLPSKKLDLALEYLSEGREWDAKLFREMDN